MSITACYAPLSPIIRHLVTSPNTKCIPIIHNSDTSFQSCFKYSLSTYLAVCCQTRSSHVALPNPTVLADLQKTIPQTFGLTAAAEAKSSQSHPYSAAKFPWLTAHTLSCRCEAQWKLKLSFGTSLALELCTDCPRATHLSPAGNRPHSWWFQWAYEIYPLAISKVQHLGIEDPAMTVNVTRWGQWVKDNLHQLLLNTGSTRICFGPTALLIHGLWWRKGSFWTGHKAALVHTEQVTIPLFFQQHQAIFLRGKLKLKECIYFPQITCYTNCSYKGSKSAKALSKAWGNKVWILWTVIVINLSAR